jgi:glycosyltransferase involved in cell wall biosynthesis
MPKKKIGIVVQRYGLEVAGGAELHARMVAERLALKYDVTILTSCALDPVSWETYYPEGETTVNGLKVIRFKNSVRIFGDPVRYLDRKFKERHPMQKVYRWLGRPRWYAYLFSKSLITKEDGEKWLMINGPGMPQLLDYLKQHENDTAAFIFFSALYYPAGMGILTVPHKSILVPTMHDEPPAYYPVYKTVMSSARWILFNSKSEQAFSEKLFPISHVNKRIVAVGIDPDPKDAGTEVLQRFGVQKPYFIYVGRIDKAKSCDTLINYFTKAVDEYRLDIQLVMVGDLMMEKVEHPFIIYTGIVSDEERTSLIKSATALIIFSLFESLSLVVLESFACKVPVIATAATEVLKDHIEQSGGGWLFADYADFVTTMQAALSDKEICREKGEAGYEYMLANYTWEKVLPQYDEAIDDVEKNTRANIHH